MVANVGHCTFIKGGLLVQCTVSYISSVSSNLVVNAFRFEDMCSSNLETESVKFAKEKKSRFFGPLHCEQYFVSQLQFGCECTKVWGLIYVALWRPNPLNLLRKKNLVSFSSCVPRIGGQVEWKQWLAISSVIQSIWKISRLGFLLSDNMAKWKQPFLPNICKIKYLVPVYLSLCLITVTSNSCHSFQKCAISKHWTVNNIFPIIDCLSFKLLHLSE